MVFLYNSLEDEITKYETSDFTICTDVRFVELKKYVYSDLV